MVKGRAKLGQGRFRQFLLHSLGAFCNGLVAGGLRASSTTSATSLPVHLQLILLQSQQELYPNPDLAQRVGTLTGREGA